MPSISSPVSCSGACRLHSSSRSHSPAPNSSPDSRSDRRFAPVIVSQRITHSSRSMTGMPPRPRSIRSILRSRLSCAGGNVTHSAAISSAARTELSVFHSAGSRFGASSVTTISRSSCNADISPARAFMPSTGVFKRSVSRARSTVMPRRCASSMRFTQTITRGVSAVT